MSRLPRFFMALFVASSALAAQDESPVVLDDRLKIELFAEHPQLVTPTGIDVDHLGRVFVIESNTHFPPEGYQGHPSDRILILENTNDDPKADKITVFADGLKFTMSAAVKPIWLEVGENGGGGVRGKNKDDKNPPASHPRTPAPSHPLTVFVATRNEILLLTDTDGDLKADEKKRLVFLETAGNYPHNALAGFAFDALGNMFFGLGENMANDYKLIGSDGTTLSGIEAGKLYRCQPDGSKLEQWATGFWNPHASCFDAFGRLFTVDNDPDSRPPCRLLHIIPGGDYGYRFRNGRKGTHPFTSWNGEIPGTLPMVAGTGEAPSGIVCYENDGFPEDYLGTLLVGSWGDHRIDQFVLEPKGASFTSKAKPIIKGGENFRPVGLAVAPDGSLYFSDWVLKDYKLHGKGRVWRVSGKENNARSKTEKPIDRVFEAADRKEWFQQLDSPNLNRRRIAARTLSLTESTVEELFTMTREIPSKLTLRGQYEAWIAVTSSPSLAAWLKARKVQGGYSRRSGSNPVKNGWRKEETFWIAGASDEFLEMLMQNATPDADRDIVNSIVETARDIFPNQPFDGLADPFYFFTLTQHLRNDPRLGKSIPLSAHLPESLRLFQFVAAFESKDAKPLAIVLGFQDDSQRIRRLAVQAVGESRLEDYRPQVEALLANPTTTPDLFLACLATLSLLDGQPASEFEKNPPTQYIAGMVKDASRPAALRAMALRMLPASAAELDAPLLQELLSSSDEILQLEAVRTLANSPLPEARRLLLPIATNPQAKVALRAEAIAGLCNGPHEEPLPKDVEALLVKYARGDVDVSDAAQKRRDIETLQLEALRSLRGRADENSKIRKEIQMAREAASDDAALREAIEIVLNGKSRLGSSDEEPRLPTTALDGGDAIAGRRVFFHHNGPLCAKCHTVQGRGGQVGPDLTVIARTMDREKLLSSILTPSKEISPQFTTWVIATATGKTHTGFILEDNRTGQIKLGTPTGEVIVLNEDEIESREPSKTSVMPEKLHERMTPQELRDLLAFLETLK